MTFIPSLLQFDGFFMLPQGLAGWLAIFALLALNLVLLYQWRRYNQGLLSWRLLVFLVLLVAVPISSLFLGLRLPVDPTLTLPDIPILPQGVAWMFLAAIPWCLAAGLLGVWPAAFLAGFSGALISFFDLHNPFIPLVYMLAGILLGAAAQQPYRTLFYRLLRHPLFAMLLVSLLYPVLFLISTLMVMPGGLALGLDYAGYNLQGNVLAFAGQLLWGALVAEVIAIGLPAMWGSNKPQEPSPFERSLENQLVFYMLPLAIGFVVLIVVGLGLSVNNASRRMLANQLGSVTAASAETLPFALETGQNLLVQVSQDERLYQQDATDQLNAVMLEYFTQTPFFNQLTYLDTDINFLAGYPEKESGNFTLLPEETNALELALLGVAFQSYSLPPEQEGVAGRLVFISTVTSPDGVIGFVLGRTRLDQNPFFAPVLENLRSLTNIGAAGMIVDERGMILFHTDPDLIGTDFAEEIDLQQPVFIPDHTSPTGARELLYIQPVPGRAWATLASVPATVAHQVALQTALPLLGLFGLLVLALYAVLRFVLRVPTRSISVLAGEAKRIASGDLDQPLASDRVDEVGQLTNALNDMRLSLKARLDEINRLLTISQGVASALEIEAAVAPILQGALSASGANAARMVLADAAIPQYDPNMRTHFGFGPSAEQYASLDDQILALTTRQAQVALANPGRAQLQSSGKPLPQALLAAALRYENVHYGALWLAYDQPHRFTEAETRFLSAVAGQAALAASNARLYLSERLGRQRMQAVLDSTPEPVLVTDHQNHLLLANPAAQALLGSSNQKIEGKPVDQIIAQKALRDLLLSDMLDTPSAPVEVEFPDSRVYFATASPVIVDQQKMGRVCLLSDITRFKELDALKSEFVSTVSHDLRSPLTTLRGYATMLNMVGDLNEQQSGYVQKIVQGIESMSRIVVALLDLGRIEVGEGLVLEMVPVSDVVSQVAEALRIEAIQKRISMNISLPGDTAPVIQADKVLLERAIQNLIDNAIKYTEAGGSVDVALRMEPDQKIAIVIRDTGIGVSPVDLPRLFERFYRAADRKTRQERGSGLGLTIVKSIAERHHGSVSAISQLGKGSTFTLRLPLRQPLRQPEK